MVGLKVARLIGSGRRGLLIRRSNPGQTYPLPHPAGTRTLRSSERPVSSSDCDLKLERLKQAACGSDHSNHRPFSFKRRCQRYRIALGSFGISAAAPLENPRCRSLGQVFSQRNRSCAAGRVWASHSPTYVANSLCAGQLTSRPRVAARFLRIWSHAYGCLNPKRKCIH